MVNFEQLTEKAREVLNSAHELAHHDRHSPIEDTNGHEPASDDGMKRQPQGQGKEMQRKGRTMRSAHRTQAGRAVGKLRVVSALAVAVMGVINVLTVLLPTRPGRLALLGNLLNQLA